MLFSLNVYTFFHVFKTFEMEKKRFENKTWKLRHCLHFTKSKTFSFWSFQSLASFGGAGGGSSIRDLRVDFIAFRLKRKQKLVCVDKADDKETWVHQQTSLSIIDFIIFLGHNFLSQYPRLGWGTKICDAYWLFRASCQFTMSLTLLLYAGLLEYVNRRVRDKNNQEGE